MTHDDIASNFNCRVLAIRQPPSSPFSSTKTHVITTDASSINLDFSQVDMTPLDLPDIHPPKIPYRLCPNPSAIIWRSRKPRRRRGGSSRWPYQSWSNPFTHSSLSISLSLFLPPYSLESWMDWHLVLVHGMILLSSTHSHRWYNTLRLQKTENRWRLTTYPFCFDWLAHLTFLLFST